MNSIFARLSFITSFLIFVFILISSANAFDQQSVLRKYQTYTQENNIIFTFSAAEKGNDGSLTLKDVDYYEEKTKLRQTIETLVFLNMQETQNGGVEYDSLEFMNFKIKSDGQNIDQNILIERVFSTGLKFADNPKEQNLLQPVFIANAEISNMRLQTGGKNGEVKMFFPSIISKNINPSNTLNFIAETIEIAPSSGTIKNNDKAPSSFTLGAMSFQNMDFFGSRGFDIGLIETGTLVMDLKNSKGQKIDVVFEGLKVANFYSPDLSVSEKPLISTKNLSAEINPLSVKIDGKDFLGWENGFGTSKNDATTNTVTSMGKFDNAFIDLSIVPQTAANAQTFNALRELDLLRMVFDLEGLGSWARDDGIIDLTSYKLTLENGAAFNISARMSGYTEQIARSFTQAMAAVNAEPDKQKRNALTLQAVSYIAGLTVERLEVSLADQSLLNRVIALQASKLNQEPEQLKGIVGPMTNILLAPYQIPEVAAQASQALNTFMQGNKKLTILIEPVGGLVATEIIALFSGVRSGSVTPAELAKRLNLTISAQ